MTRIGIIGTGSIAKTHAIAIQNLDDIASLHAVSDIEKERAEKFAIEYKAKRVYGDYRDLLADNEIDMVCVCTPAFSHAEITIASIQAEKAVLCEKPIAGSLCEIDSVIEAVRKYNGVVNSVFQCRYGQGIQLFKTLQNEGITGKLLLGQVNVFWRRTMDYYNSAPWRGTWKGEMGGALITLAVHAIDAFCMLIDDPVSICSVVETLNHDIETDDTSCSILRLKDGGMASINVTSNNQTEESLLKLICEHVIAISNTAPYSPTAWPWTFHSSDKDIQRQLDEHTKNIKPSSKDGSHEMQIRDFVNHLQKRDEPPVTVYEARRSLEIITGIYKSGITGEIVQFPIEKDDPFYKRINGGYKKC